MRILWLIVWLGASRSKYHHGRLCSSLEDGRPNLFVFWTPIYCMPLGQMSKCGGWTCPMLWVELHFIPDKALHFQFRSWYYWASGKYQSLRVTFCRQPSTAGTLLRVFLRTGYCICSICVLFFFCSMWCALFDVWKLSICLLFQPLLLT